MSQDIIVPEGVKEIGLAGICDWHYGSHTCNEAGCRRWVKKIKDNGWYWVGLGDLTENALKDTLGDIYIQKYPPEQQVDDVTEMLDPIKDQCVGMVAGNHGVRTTARVGLDPDRRIAKDLGVGNRYSTDFLITTLVMYDPATRYRTFWNVVAHHTTGGGATVEGKLRALRKLANSRIAYDLYLGAHGHSTVACTVNPSMPHNSGRGSREVRVRQHFSSCGSLLFYDGSYAAAKALPPADPSQVVHYLGARIQHRKDRRAPDGWLKPYRREAVPL